MSPWRSTPWVNRNKIKEMAHIKGFSDRNKNTYYNLTIVLIVVSSRFIAVLTQYTVVKLKSALPKMKRLNKVG